MQSDIFLIDIILEIKKKCKKNIFYDEVERVVETFSLRLVVLVTDTSE